jgi:hypothetical protein
VQQAICFLLHDRVALTTAPFKTGAIKYRNMAASIADQSGLLQVGRCVCHTFAANTQPVRDNLMGHEELTGVQSVQSSE